MPDLADIGKKVLVRHLLTGELHVGYIIDVKNKGYILRMDESAKIFLDRSMLLDTEYYAFKWKIVEISDD